MAKTKISLVILGSVILLIIGALISYFILVFTNNIQTAKTAIEITIQDNSKVYDGTPLSAKEYKITNGTLLKGHNIDINYYGEITEAGIGESNCNLKIVDDNGRDYTNDYNITIKKGKLEVNKRLLYLEPKANAESIDYDDNLTDEISYNIVNSTLCNGHTIVPQFENGDINEIDGTENLETTFSLTAEIYDIVGTNVTDNYDIRYTDKAVTINKPLLTFRTLSYEKDYDGIPFNPTKDDIELVNGSLPASYYYDDVDFIKTSYTNVSESDYLEIKDIVIKNSYGDPVTNNYRILNQNIGRVNIKPVEITVDVDSINEVYDGQEHYNNQFTLVYPNNNSGKATTQNFEINGEEFTISSENYENHVAYKTITNVGSMSNDISFTIKNLLGDEVTENFKINYKEFATLTISKRPLVIYGPDISEEPGDFNISDKLKFDSDNKLRELICSGLCEDDEIINYDYVIPVISTDEEGSYEFEFNKSALKINNKKAEDVSSNYDISTIRAKLSIRSSKITVRSAIKQMVIPYTEDVESYAKVTNLSLLYFQYGKEISKPEEIDDDSFDIEIGIDSIRLTCGNENYNVDEIEIKIKYEVGVMFKTMYYGKLYSEEEIRTFYCESYDYSKDILDPYILDGTYAPGEYAPSKYLIETDSDFVYKFLNNIVIEKDTLTVKWHNINKNTSNISGFTVSKTDCTVTSASGKPISDYEVVDPLTFSGGTGAYVSIFSVSYCCEISVEHPEYYNIEYIPGVIVISYPN